MFTTDWRAGLHLLPEYMQGAMERWVEHGISPGSFLRAVLENDLMRAMSAADSENSYRLRDYAMYLYNYAPVGCYGNIDRVQAWENHRGLQKYLQEGVDSI